MDTPAIVLLVLAAGSLAAAAWLGLARARLAARVAELSAGLESARIERERAEHQCEQVRQRVEDAMQRAGTLEVEAAGLRERAAAAEKAHQAELRRHEEIYAERLEALQNQRSQVEREHAGRMAELNKRFEETFRSLASEALKSSREDFLRLAQKAFEVEREKSQAEIDKRRAAVDELVKPIGETLKKTDEKLAEIEKARAESFATLSEQVRAMADANQFLRQETGRLVRALRQPHVRGRYGEVQLRRVAELAGMQAYCDFSEQDSATDADGNPARPDMVVRLPNDRCIIVDAKCNIAAYLDAVDAQTPEEAEGHLDRYARHVADQAAALAKKKYWALRDYDGSPEFVVMFIPGDQFVDAALARKPDILESAAQQGVILASPSTLIGLLRAVAVGYKEQRLAREAEELRRLGVELHERASIAYGFAARLGESIEAAVRRYNDFVGSYQSRLEPTLRRFEESGVRSAKDLPEIKPLAVRARLPAGGEEIAAAAPDFPLGDSPPAR